MPDYLEFDVTLKGRFRVKLEADVEVDKAALMRKYEAQLNEGTFNEVIFDSVSRVYPV